jgi:inward rectifier potassium channel
MSTTTPPTPIPTRPRPIRYEGEDRDLARVVSRGRAVRPGADAYFGLLTIPFWHFCVTVTLLVLAINSVFAWIYTLIPGGVSNVRPGSFEDAFFFSVQTLATIGYGTMAPQTRVAHIVVTIESILGIIAVGSLAGISFARVSRPKALVLFCSKLVVRDRNGVPHLQVRLANWRTNLIVEARLRVFLLVTENTEEGEHNRMPLDLKLVRGSTPAFFLTWTVMHCIDATSPFYGEDAIERLQASGTQLYVMLTGYDHTLGQVVHAYHQYKFSDIVHGAQFVDIVGVAPDGTRTIDFARFHDIEPIGSMPQAADGGRASAGDEAIAVGGQGEPFGDPAESIDG